ncbi:hypothetical protein HYS31_03960 [Candidatus Woesearchaeota archaeon]|nr:hypothetical protein [Candidatus Woesearchaeota archaeon]
MSLNKLLLFLVAFIFLINACSETETLTGNIIKEPVNEIETKTPPSQEIKEIKEEKPACINQCSSNRCEGFSYILCLSGEDDCKSEINKGIVKGKCGVECNQDSECSNAKKCQSYKCECSDKCSSDSCSGFEFISCESDLDGCKNSIRRGLIKGKCNVDCVSNSDCSSNYECLTYKCIKKISENVESQASTISDSLKQLQEKLKEQQKINSKVDECAKLCAGEQYNIPYVKDTFWSTCYEVYYYAGEEALNEMIADCK